MVTRIPALIFDGIVKIGCLYFLYFLYLQKLSIDAVNRASEAVVMFAYIIKRDKF